jgi:hypothetical protein
VRGSGTSGQAVVGGEVLGASSKSVERATAHGVAGGGAFPAATAGQEEVDGPGRGTAGPLIAFSIEQGAG